MSRLIVLLALFLVSYAAAISQPPDIDHQLNSRMIELYNAKDFSTLVKEVNRD